MNPNIKRRGMLIILSSPSGVGKTSISKAILARDLAIRLSVSATTRSQRAGEVEGKDYFFLSQEQFKAHRDNSDFIESALVYGNYYGTFRTFVDKSLADGVDVMFDIDWQGAQQLAQVYAQDMVRIFVLPPSVEQLETRLRDRKTDNEEVIKYRMSNVTNEISHWAEYEYVVINEKLEDTINAIHAIIRSERLKRRRQVDIADFVQKLRMDSEKYVFRS